MNPAFPMAPSTMRTRKANNAKSYSEDIYNSESDADTPSKPSEKRKVKEKDEIFSEEGEKSNHEEAPLSDAEEPVLEEEQQDATPVTKGKGKESKVKESKAKESKAKEPKTKGAKGKAKAKTPKSPVIKPFQATAAKSTEPPPYLELTIASQELEKVRGYVGATDRGTHGSTLLSAWYGPDQDSLQIIKAIQQRWVEWKVLPPKDKPRGYTLPDVGIWIREKTQYLTHQYAEPWVARIKQATDKGDAPAVALSEDEAAAYRFPQNPMPVLVGKSQDPTNTPLSPGEGYCVSQGGIPFQDDENEGKVPTGWIFDTGGVVLSLDWASRQDPSASQLLALAVIPQADQEDYNYNKEAEKPDFQKFGTVQVWEVEGKESDTGYLRPSPAPPKLKRTLCLDYGRAHRVKWSPLCEYLAILCGNGNVYVVDPNAIDAQYTKIVNPAATLALNNETTTKAGCMTWINLNRLVVGYSDGSLALWSIHPTRILSRHPVHHSPVTDVVSAAPTLPYMVASFPVGGNLKLIDLRSPSLETTEVQTSSIYLQPGVLCYSDHLLGFFMQYPSSKAANTVLSFAHYAHFPLVRTVFTGESLLSSLAVGKTHPFLLVGTLDGSIWCMNPVAEMLSKRYDSMDRLRLFQHEHRSAKLHATDSEAAVRGASRIVHGFPIEQNKNTKAEPKKPAKKGTGKIEEDDDDTVRTTDASKLAIRDVGTRITAAEWNPNGRFGCWAAIGMASGLVKVMDLGIEILR